MAGTYGFSRGGQMNSFMPSSIPLLIKQILSILCGGHWAWALAPVVIEIILLFNQHNNSDIGTLAIPFLQIRKLKQFLQMGIKKLVFVLSVHVGEGISAFHGEV